MSSPIAPRVMPPPPPVVEKKTTELQRIRDALMMAFRIGLFVWAVRRIHACRGEDWWISIVRAFGWSLVKEFASGILNSIVLGLAMLLTSRSGSPVETLLKVGKALTFVLMLLNVAFEVAFMTWASSCAV